MVAPPVLVAPLGVFRLQILRVLQFGVGRGLFRVAAAELGFLIPPCQFVVRVWGLPLGSWFVGKEVPLGDSWFLVGR